MKKVKISAKAASMAQRLPTVHAAIEAHTTLLAEEIRATAPVHTGHYKASVRSYMLGTPWARGRVAVGDFKAHWIEEGAGVSPVRGWRPFPGRHVMQNAVRALGMRWRGWNT